MLTSCGGERLWEGTQETYRYCSLPGGSVKGTCSPFQWGKTAGVSKGIVTDGKSKGTLTTTTDEKEDGTKLLGTKRKGRQMKNENSTPKKGHYEKRGRKRVRQNRRQKRKEKNCTP